MNIPHTSSFFLVEKLCVSSKCIDVCLLVTYVWVFHPPFRVLSFTLLDVLSPLLLLVLYSSSCQACVRTLSHNKTLLSAQQLSGLLGQVRTGEHACLIQRGVASGVAERDICRQRMLTFSLKVLGLSVIVHCKYLVTLNMI